MQNITYVFSGNREERYLKNKIEAKDFFYGLTELDKDRYSIEIIEFSNNKNIFIPLFKYIDVFFQKVVSLPFNTKTLLNSRNIRTFINTDIVVMVSETVGCSSLPLIIISKLFFKKPRSYLFVMGLYSKRLRFKKFKFLHNAVLKLNYALLDGLLFLGEGELTKARKIHKKHDKLIYFPFSIDTNFWKKSDDFKFEENENLIFVGNDGNRDDKLFLEIVEKLNWHNFTAVSSIPSIVKSKLTNLETYEGQLASNKIKDIDLKNIYQKSKIAVIPLKESTQPSGQSVALQCMSLGIPVIISKTSGFWDNHSFKNYENIIFVEKNNLSGWIDVLEKVYNDHDLLNKISQNARITVEEKFNLKNFTNKLNLILDNSI